MSDPQLPAHQVPTDPTSLPAALVRGRASRRQLIQTAGLVALAGAGVASLAACGSDSSAAPAAPAASSAAGGSGAGATVPTASVPEGSGFIMTDGSYVVTQPEKGTYKAFNKTCTHAGCPVSKIVDQQIVCACHGSHFSITDGSVLSGPAKAPLAAATAKVSGSTITIS